jgi:hypothetical protein
MAISTPEAKKGARKSVRTTVTLPDYLDWEVEVWRTEQLSLLGRIPSKGEALEALLKIALMTGKTIKEADQWKPGPNGKQQGIKP